MSGTIRWLDMDPRQVLEKDFPGLRIDALERLGEGWDHVAFLVNGSFVFRLPWHLVEPADREPDVPTASAEVALLRAVAGRLPVAVPEPVYVADGGDYFGYRFLPGRSLEDLLAGGSPLPAAADQFADLVVDVVMAIDDVVAVGDAAAMGIRRAVPPHYPDAEEHALRSGRLTTGMSSVFGWVVEALPRLWSAAMARPVATLHADLGLDHWLVDDDSTPYALIDWSDSCIGPPELQLAALMWHVPELTANVARRYAQHASRVIDGDLVLSCGYVNALTDLGELLGDDDDDGRDEGDEAGIEWCLEFLHRWSQPDLAATLRGVRFTS